MDAGVSWLVPAIVNPTLGNSGFLMPWVKSATDFRRAEEAFSSPQGPSEEPHSTVPHYRLV